MSTTNNKDEIQNETKKHPVLLHALYDGEGSVCPYKSGGWVLLFILIVVVCVVASQNGKGASKVAGSKVAGGGTSATIRTLAPSVDELLSEVTSLTEF